MMLCGYVSETRLTKLQIIFSFTNSFKLFLLILHGSRLNHTQKRHLSTLPCSENVFETIESAFSTKNGKILKNNEPVCVLMIECDPESSANLKKAGATRSI